MSGSEGRRVFLKQAGAAALLAAGGPFVLRSRASAQSDRLVVAVGQWGTETPLPWRNTQAEKPLWDHVYDPLIQRDPKTFAYQPGLATEWKPSNEMRTWTFKLRPGVKFHEGFGEMTVRGRQVHGRAELQARRASAAPPTSFATTSTASRRPTSSRW